jgi:hypothetical protein
MLVHALSIVMNELRDHLNAYQDGIPREVELGNLSDGLGNTGIPRTRLNFSVVNLKEEKALKNLQNYVRNDTALKVTYENPPVFLNFLVLITATHDSYPVALNMLSRTIRFFQYKNVFTQDTVAASSLDAPLLARPDDVLESFKLIFDLYSPTLEEINHMWGILGGRQYPSVLYMMRILDLKFKAVQGEGGLITNVVSDFQHKDPLPN